MILIAFKVLLVALLWLHPIIGKLINKRFPKFSLTKPYADVTTFSDYLTALFLGIIAIGLTLAFGLTVLVTIVWAFTGV